MFQTFFMTLHTFFYLCLRDLYALRSQYRRLLINFCIILPVVLSLSFGYFLPNTILHDPTVRQTTTLFVGSFLWSIFPLSFSFFLPLFMDIHQGDRFVDYQLLLIAPRWLLIQKLLFTATVVWVHMVPFFPLSKLLLRGYIDTTHTHWLGLFVLLYCAALVCCAYNLFVVCYVDRIENIKHVWMRVTFPLMQLGGFMVPWAALNAASYTLGLVSRFNPFVYITEGARNAVVGGEQFFPLWLCCTALLAFTMFLTLLSCWAFRRQVDHV